MHEPYFREWEPLLPPTGAARGAMLVFSPHPDDEVIGCGGLILGHRLAGHSVSVAIMSDGRLGDPGGDQSDAYVEKRKSECRAAAQILGVDRTSFLDFPDCQLADLFSTQHDTVVDQLLTLLAQENYATVALPSPFELHPDHKATFLLGFDAWQKAGAKERLLLYEVGSLMPCNFLLDVTPLGDQKDEALRCYASQLEHHDILAKVKALDLARCANIPDGAVERCEGYLEIHADSADEFRSRVDDLLKLTDSMKPGVSGDK